MLDLGHDGLARLLAIGWVAPVRSVTLSFAARLEFAVFGHCFFRGTVSLALSDDLEARG
jgi:hypothetical protein